jgi:hypothetical protein
MALLKRIVWFCLFGFSLSCSQEDSENPLKKSFIGSVWEIKRVEIIDPTSPDTAPVLFNFEISNASRHSYLIFRNEDFIIYVDEQLGINNSVFGTCGQWDIDVDRLQFGVPQFPAEVSGGCFSKNGLYYAAGAYAMNNNSLYLEGWGASLGRIRLEASFLDRVISGSLKSRTYFERVNTDFSMMEPACCPTLEWVN